MDIQVANRLRGTEEYYFSHKLREIEEINKQGEKVINLGIGSPDLPPAPSVVETLATQAALPGNHGYQSYKGAPQLRLAMAEWYRRQYGVTLNPDTEILPLMGSKEGILHVCMTYLEEGDEALIPDPGYPTYASAVRLSGATSVPYRLDASRSWLPDLEQLAASDLSRVKLMWLNYPHMPTGAKADRGFFEELVVFARENQLLLCHDNPYSLILNDKPLSMLGADNALDVGIELNSLSKSSNMAGWRIGMLLGNAQRVSEILRFKSNMDSGMFLPMQLAAAEALSLDNSWYTATNRHYAARKVWAHRLLDRLGCTYQEDQAGLFVWAEIPADRYASGYALSDVVLAQARVFITPGGIFGEAGKRYVRVSLCADTDTFRHALERIENMKFSTK